MSPATRSTSASLLSRIVFGLIVFACHSMGSAAPVDTGFADVSPDSYAAPYIKTIKDAGITSGCGNGNYCPGLPVTRETMAVMIVRAIEGEPAADACNGANPFADVAAARWSCPHIKRMAELGITAGCGNGSFCPTQNVTREQMAAFLVRALEGNPSGGYCGTTSPFSDVAVGSTFCGHIKRIQELAVTTGCGGGNYCPSQVVTREQMAIFLARAFLGMTTAPRHTLTVQASGATAVPIAGNLPEYSGTASYTRNVIDSVKVTLHAPVGIGSLIFKNWSGCDSQAGDTCTVTMNSAKSVTASFAAPPQTFMGSSKVLIGGSFSDATATAAPFDARYAYVHSKPAASPAYYTDTLCSAAATASGWWGCWPGTTTPPGYYVTWWDEHVAQATWQGSPRPQMFFWTWYSLRDLGDMAGQGDGPGEVQAINRTDLLTLYMNDYRFFLQKIGNTRAMVDIEPDFWGYVKSLGNPHNVPARVTAANPTDCPTQENSAAGLAHCLVAMARKYAPNLGVGMHASCFDYQWDPQGCVQFLQDMTTGADFMVGDVSDRDAAWYDLQGQNWHWWDGTKGAEALAFYKTITEGTGKPLVLWQIPLGNMNLNNTLNHYRDDKVDYLFSHMDQVADAHVAALLFGAGHGEQTSAETDGGNLINKTINYWQSGGTPLR